MDHGMAHHREGPDLARRIAEADQLVVEDGPQHPHEPPELFRRDPGMGVPEQFGGQSRPGEERRGGDSSPLASQQRGPYVVGADR
ncbi:hypothetical protein SGA01_46550 [Streptomyces gardneri]|uniref:Uncharacterized protein n=1 Tax=Streptomyces gardneri TaxID=66892 RepID=A0A4Y3RT24_9ACTN|nr:hypothetical protein SGA01_46550 [Streptomyces gardneri]